MIKINKLPDDTMVNVVQSNCPTCNGQIRSAVEHMMGKKNFYKEVVKHNLSVATMPLLEYRKLTIKWCECYGK